MLLFVFSLILVRNFCEASSFLYTFTNGTCASNTATLSSSAPSNLCLWLAIGGNPSPYRPNDPVPICGFNANCATFTTTFYTCPNPTAQGDPTVCVTPVFTTVGQGKGTCLEYSNGGGIFLEACGTSVAPTLSPSSVSTLCSPQVGVNKKSCDKLISTCGIANPMKWTGKGCKVAGLRMFDGGCQCKNYCGYTCKSACNKDSMCNWVGPVQGGTCNSRATGLPGVAIPRC
jgi:hypothetical protein